MEERKHVETYHEKRTSNVPRTILGIIFTILELVFVARILLKLLGANASNNLVNLLYTYTDPVVNPIKNFLGDMSVTALSSNGILELASIAILLGLIILGAILMSLFKPKVIHETRTEEREVRQEETPVRTEPAKKQPVIERHGQTHVEPAPVVPIHEAEHNGATVAPMEQPASGAQMSAENQHFVDDPIIVDEEPRETDVVQEQVDTVPTSVQENALVDDQRPVVSEEKNVEVTPQNSLVDDQRNLSPERTEEIIVDNTDPDNVVIHRKDETRG